MDRIYNVFSAKDVPYSKSLKCKNTNFKNLIMTRNITEDTVSEIPVMYALYLPQPHSLDPETEEAYNVNVCSQEFIQKHIKVINTKSLSTRPDILEKFSDDFFTNYIEYLDKDLVILHARSRNLPFLYRFLHLTEGRPLKNITSSSCIENYEGKDDFLLDFKDGKVYISNCQVDTRDPKEMFYMIEDKSWERQCMLRGLDLANMFNSILYAREAKIYWSLVSIFPMTISFAYEFRYYLDWIHISCTNHRSKQFIEFFKDWMYWGVIYVNDLYFMDYYSNYCTGTYQTLSFYVTRNRINFDNNPLALEEESRCIDDPELFQRVKRNITKKKEYCKTVLDVRETLNFPSNLEYYLIMNVGELKKDQIEIPEVLLRSSRMYNVSEDVLRNMISNIQFGTEYGLLGGIVNRYNFSPKSLRYPLPRFLQENIGYIDLEYLIVCYNLSKEFIDLIYGYFPNGLDPLIFMYQDLEKLEDTNTELYTRCKNLKDMGIDYTSPLKNL